MRDLVLLHCVSTETKVFSGHAGNGALYLLLKTVTEIVHFVIDIKRYGSIKELLILTDNP